MSAVEGVAKQEGAEAMKGALAAVVIGFVLAVGAVALSSKWLAAPEPLPHVITVTGESRLVGEPDTAVVSFGVSKSAKTVAAGQRQVATLMNKVIAAVIAAGVKKEDIATSDLSIYQNWDYKKNVSTGFTVSNTVTITVRNVQHVGHIIDTAIAAGLNRLQGVSYYIRSPEWKKKATREALANARERAEAMAKGAGRRLGRVVSVREGAEWQAAPQEGLYYGHAAYPYSGMEAPPATRALPGQRAMTLQVEVVYEL
jgi:uncharacterized protein YggE